MSRVSVGVSSRLDKNTTEQAGKADDPARTEGDRERGRQWGVGGQVAVLALPVVGPHVVLLSDVLLEGDAGRLDQVPVDTDMARRS